MPTSFQDASLRPVLMGNRWQVALLVLVLMVHAGGRMAAFCAPDKVDSVTYSLAAYRLWQPDATYRDVVPDKPPGQAVLTGWVYRIWPGSPSRLALVPIESLFLIGAYATIYVLARRRLGASIATIVTLLFALAENTCNVTDYTTDGFNLAECYLALPMLLAVSFHFMRGGDTWRGFGRGLALGAAIGIKQTAVGLLVVFILHDVYRRWWCTDREQRTVVAWLATCAGVAAGLAPVLVVLIAHGWFAQHVHDLVWFSGSRVGARGATWPPFLRLQAMLPIAWFVIVGIASLAAMRFHRKCPGTGQGLVVDAPIRDLAVLAALWLVVEAIVIAVLPNPSSHYYQQLAAPGSLLAGTALLFATSQMRMWSRPLRVSGVRWLLATGAVLAIFSALPLAHLARVRMAWPDRVGEVRLFEESLQTGRLNDVIQQIRQKHAAQF